MNRRCAYIHNGQCFCRKKLGRECDIPVEKCPHYIERLVFD